MSNGTDLFERLIGRLRDDGLATDPESLADALWLSERMGPPDAGDRPPPLARPGPAGTAPPRRGRPAGHAADGTRLLPREPAPRPLQHYRPPARPRMAELDEIATAETSARSGQITPVFRQVGHREAQLLLVMDDSPSMVVWDPVLDELRQICGQVGAFRDVGVHYLRLRPDGEAGIGAGPGGPVPLAPGDRLRDPTGRTVLLLLSDCSGALWRHGAAQRLLHRFARTGPVAVLQPLPQRMWARTWLPAEPGMLRTTQGAGGRLEFVPRRRRHWYGGLGALAVPVLAPSRSELGAWARALSGTARVSLDAAAAWVEEDDAGGLPAWPPEVDAGRLVAEFQALSSPAAHDLAVYLSAAPLLHPVMRLVQEAMMPQTGPAEMAEVLLGGLLDRPDALPPLLPGQRHPPTAPATASGGPWYAFAPGVRDLLLRRLGLGEASLVLKHCATYVERTYGRRAPNAPATVVGYLSGTAGPGGPAVPAAPDGSLPVPAAFADAALRVLRRFQPGGVLPAALGEAGTGVVMTHGGRAVDAAAERLARFREHGTIRDLWEAIRLLRGAPADPARPDVSVPHHTLLAECLLALWEVRPGGELLAEAARTARAATALAGRQRSWPLDPPAVPDPVAGRAYLMHGRVLLSVARTAPSTADSVSALARAAARLGRAEALLRAAPRDLLATRLCLVELAREQYRHTGDHLPLRRAALRLDAVLAGWPSDDPLPRGALAARGRLLAALADDALRRGEPDEARGFALRAAADFAALADRAAADVPPAPRGEAAQALLDLAAARAVAAGDPASRPALAALRRLLDGADAGDDQRFEALRRIGRAHAAHYARTRRSSELNRAARALARAQPLVPALEPVRAAELLAERGRVLVEWAGHGGGRRVAGDAVRVLRESLARTPEGDPSTAARRLLFGRALRARYQAGGARADLHEAEGVLARAGRAAPEAAVVVAAWLERGGVLLDLALADDDRFRLVEAADSYLRAAAAAERSGDVRSAARAHHLHGAALEETVGPEAAAASYRTAWALWQRAGAAREPQAGATADRLRELRRRKLGGGWSQE